MHWICGFSSIGFDDLFTEEMQSDLRRRRRPIRGDRLTQFPFNSPQKSAPDASARST